ncbi:MAG: hypothetical protein NVS4B12_15200 [Ktedonobacteraceae bacterium]
MSIHDDKLQALLHDLQELEVFLQGRGEKTRKLSLQFAENAKRDPSNREFDLNQSRMLDYQHGVWNDIANLVEKLIKKYE